MLKELLSKIDAKLLKRFAYYFVGLSLGIVALTYFNKQKGSTFYYLPNARVLEQIRLKDTLKISDKAQKILTQYHLDSMDLQYALHKGNWDRAKSHVHQKPCPDYWIDATIGKKINDTIARHLFSFIIERCEYTATIKDIKVNYSSK